MLQTTRTRGLAAFAVAAGFCLATAALAEQAAKASDGADMPATSTQSQGHSGVPAPANHLAKETSPYLLQHAHNPVDWYPWGSEAFEKARREDKLIFLSIGYSTCYWCHVMERECFENEPIAKLMNDNFVCVKVDREERPDVDDIYMTALQIISGQGGWPMSLFLEPKTLKPFLGGTYFPPEDAGGRPGFPSVLKQMADYWKNKKDAVVKQSDRVADAVKEHLAVAAQPTPIGAKTVEKAVALLMAQHDDKDGGFTGPQRAPKFPTPVNIDLLMAAGWDFKPTRDAAILTLDRMAAGGMYDQAGGGFHRYSVDEKWLVPHFEKMLYDNGQLASTYARAYELTKDPFYAQVLRETLDYVLREMTDKDGAFLSAQDAEVRSREGDNYLWTPDQVREALGAAGLKDDADFALKAYGLDRGPNFQDPHHPELPPRNVLFLSDRPDRLAAALKTTPEEFNARIAKIDAALLKARDAREQPRKDDKILAAWNGLMIAGMADGGRVLDERRYQDAAMRAANFILQKMRAPDGSLMRSSKGGVARIDAFLEDYAMVIHGLVALHRATGNYKLLDDAKALAGIANAKFRDAAGGAYFDTLPNQSDLFVRAKSMTDGALPSGNSMMLIDLLDLHELTGEASWLDDAALAMRAMSGVIGKQPAAMPLAAIALNRFAAKYPQKLDGAAVAAGGGGAAGASKGMFSYEQKAAVTLSADPVEVSMKSGASATFNVVVNIDPAYHISSHEPGDEDLVPLVVKLVGGEGLRFAVQYPKGEAYKGASATGTVYVHKGQVRIPVTIEQTGAVTGRPQIAVTYQACTEQECLEPKTEIVGVRIVAQR